MSRTIFDIPVLRGRLGRGLGELPHKSRERARSRVVFVLLIIEELGFVRDRAVRQVSEGEDRAVARRRELLLLVRVGCARVNRVAHGSPDRDRRWSEGTTETSGSALLLFEVSDIRKFQSLRLANLPAKRTSRARSARRSSAKFLPSEQADTYLSVVAGSRQSSAKLVKPGLLNPIFVLLRFLVSHLALPRSVIVPARRARRTPPQQLIRDSAPIHGRAQDRSRGIFAHERLAP